MNWPEAVTFSIAIIGMSNIINTILKDRFGKQDDYQAARRRGRSYSRQA